MLRKFLTGLALWLAAGTAFAGITSASAEKFFSFPKISEVKISPDGKYLALVISDPKTGDFNKALAIVTTGSDHKLTASFKMLGYQIADQIWWTLDDRLLLATATTDTGIIDPPVWDGYLFAINADGTKQRPLMPPSMDMDNGHLMGGVAHDQNRIYFGGPIYMQSDDPKRVTVFGLTYGNDHGYHWQAQAFDLDVYNGALKPILQSPLQDGGFITDNEGAIRFVTGQNQKTGDPALLYRADPNSHDWQDLSALLADDDPAGSEIGPIGMTPDENGVYWYGRTPTSTIGLYSMDLKTQKLTELYSDPGVDLENYVMQNLIWSFDWIKPRKVVAVETMPGLPQVHIIDSDDPKAQDLASLYQAFDGQHVSITSNTRDGNLMVVRVSSDRNPGQFYLYDAKTGQASFLFASKPEIDPDQMASMQPVSFPARDGVTLHGYLTLPSGSSGKNLPLILMVHGGPHGIRDTWGWDPEVQYFASHGYAVLQVNYRGSGGYGMKFQDLGYGHWSTTMQDDLADGVEWAKKQGTADPNRVCIYGASYGGYAAMESGERYPNLYKCIVGYVGLYDLKTMNDSDFSHYASGKHYTGTVVGKQDAILTAESPVSGADKIAAPVFIAYGGMDQRVVPANAEEMMAALDKAGKKYQKLYEPLEMHGFYKPEHRFDLYSRMLAFIDANIGPNAPKH
ncbi:MAG TPA: S9 family peptidase [Gammaproteobacteria bacterium]|nr:S9 family peptidase [Gammaproteobacteria bacterium]